MIIKVLVIQKSLKVVESLRTYMQALQLLSKHCKCLSITGEQYCKELCRDAFLNGIESATIQQRLLENESLKLEKAFDQASTLDLL